MSSDSQNNSSAPPIHSQLKKFSENYDEARIIKVTEHVYVAVNYAIANMIMLEGTDGIIIVDTTESEKCALEILGEFRKITSKPIKGIVLTHFHADHTAGASSLLQSTDDGGKSVQVFAHSTFMSETMKSAITSECMVTGAQLQFGTRLKHGSERACSGLGSYYHVPPKLPVIAVPTTTFESEASYELAGIKFTLFHTPGETDDQITVWIPEWKVVLPADNIYKTFPNLYAIRGTPYRDCEAWYRSLDKVRRLNAEHMVPSHTEPVSGREKVYDIITHYRDAIQFITDQTMRLLNLGYKTDEIVEKVRLPSSVAAHPYLQEHYGMVCWSVRSVITGNIGWYDRDPINLFPVSKESKMERLNQLLSREFEKNTSGIEKMLLMAEETMENGNKPSQTDIVWSLDMSLQALKLSTPESRLHKKAQGVATSCLHAMAACMVNPVARNSFLMFVKCLSDKDLLQKGSEARQLVRIKAWPMNFVMEKLRYSLRAENCSDTDAMTVVFVFTDLGQKYSYTLRHCILEYHNEPDLIPKDFDLKLTTNSMVLRDLLTKERTVSSLTENGRLQMEGNVQILEQFMDLVDICKGSWD